MFRVLHPPSFVSVRHTDDVLLHRGMRSPLKEVVRLEAELRTQAAEHARELEVLQIRLQAEEYKVTSERALRVEAQKRADEASGRADEARGRADEACKRADQSREWADKAIKWADASRALSIAQLNHQPATRRRRPTA